MLVWHLASGVWPLALSAFRLPPAYLISAVAGRSMPAMA